MNEATIWVIRPEYFNVMRLSVPLKIVHCLCWNENGPMLCCAKPQAGKKHDTTKSHKITRREGETEQRKSDSRRQKKTTKNKNRHDARHTENIKSNQITKSRNLLNEWAEFAHYTTEKAIFRVRSLALPRKINIITCTDFLFQFFFSSSYVVAVVRSLFIVRMFLRSSSS